MNWKSPRKTWRKPADMERQSDCPQNTTDSTYIEHGVDVEEHECEESTNSVEEIDE